DGIPKDKINCFFDLGESTKSDPMTGKRLSTTVGYKGHGTKIFYNSEGIILETWHEGKYINSKMENPRAKLFSGEIPEYTDPVEITEKEEGYKHKVHGKNGTKVTIIGYQPNVTDPTAHLSHVTIKDYILWFSKYGSIETIFNEQKNYKNRVLYLRAFDTDRIKPELKVGNEYYENGYEVIPFGHVFPKECYTNNDLQRLQLDISDQGKEVNKADLLCREVYSSINETGKDRPDVPFQIVFYIEGDETKRLYNKMLTPKGRTPKIHDDQYTVESRYGLWACKDFIPTVNITNWIETRGIKTRFHAFINCDKFELTANRSTIDNTPSDIMQKIRERMRGIYKDIIQNSNEYKEIEKMIEEEEKHRRLKQDEKEFKKRVKKFGEIKTCTYKGTTLFEPKTEAEVYGLLMTFMALKPDLFDFEILDYRTDKGIDFLIKRKEEDIEVANFKYVELKHILSGSFNHAFKFLYKVICYKIERGTNRIAGVDGLYVLKVNKDKETKYYLVPESPSPGKENIEVVVLDTFLKEKLNIEFS
ncbi:MAG TPA: hypothetical protein VMX17_11900, partial [Candidatus Glassbacteria bacterium]|nr:hypothetical protein [Candidatus Glassbacteria bacterium]